MLQIAYCFIISPKGKIQSCMYFSQFSLCIISAISMFTSIHEQTKFPSTSSPLAWPFCCIPTGGSHGKITDLIVVKYLAVSRKSNSVSPVSIKIKGCIKNCKTQTFNYTQLVCLHVSRQNITNTSRNTNNHTLFIKKITAFFFYWIFYISLQFLDKHKWVKCETVNSLTLFKVYRHTFTNKRQILPTRF